MALARFIASYRRMTAGEVAAVVAVALAGLAALVEWVRWLSVVG